MTYPVCFQRMHMHTVMKTSPKCVNSNTNIEDITLYLGHRDNKARFEPSLDTITGDVMRT